MTTGQKFKLNKETTKHIDWWQDAAYVIDDITFLLIEQGGYDYDEAAERADIYVMRTLSQNWIDRNPPRP